MLVKDVMTRHPIMVSPDVSVLEAQQLMGENNVRHLPVVGDGKRLVGLLTRQRLAFKPDTLGSLNVWEISRYLADLKVKKMMLKRREVHTIEVTRTVERAARLMSDHKIGCLPVVEENEVVVGILSEVDILTSLQEMLGLPAPGVRVTVRMPDKGAARSKDEPSEFVKLMQALATQGWGVMGVGTFPTPRREGFYDAVLKIPNTTIAEVQEVLGQIPGQEIVDIRKSD